MKWILNLFDIFIWVTKSSISFSFLLCFAKIISTLPFGMYHLICKMVITNFITFKLTSYRHFIMGIWRYFSPPSKSKMEQKQNGNGRFEFFSSLILFFCMWMWIWWILHPRIGKEDKIDAKLRPKCNSKRPINIIYGAEEVKT